MAVHSLEQIIFFSLSGLLCIVLKICSMFYQIDMFDYLSGGGCKALSGHEWG
jgi:hypothetical protein